MSLDKCDGVRSARDHTAVLHVRTNVSTRPALDVRQDEVGQLRVFWRVAVALRDAGQLAL